MTATEALTILDQATQPQNVGKVTREGYAQIQQALEVIKAALAAQPVA